MRAWLEQQVAHGPLNGAMRHETLDVHQVRESLGKREALDVSDINGIRRNNMTILFDSATRTNDSIDATRPTFVTPNENQGFNQLRQTLSKAFEVDKQKLPPHQPG